MCFENKVDRVSSFKISNEYLMICLECNLDSRLSDSTKLKNQGSHKVKKTSVRSDRRNLF